MDNPINGMIIDLVVDTARETRDSLGLEALLVLLDKIGEKPGLATQAERISYAKAFISEKIRQITSGSSDA